MNWNWLQTAYPFENTFLEKRNTILTISLFASLVVILLQPYGFTPMDRIYHFMAFMAISIITFTINYFGLPYFFPSFFEESRWSITKAFLFLTYNFLLIGLWNHIINALIVNNDIEALVSGNELINWLLKNLAIGIVSAGFLILFRYNVLARKYLQISQELNEQFQKQLKFQEPNNNDPVVLTLEKKEFVFNKNEILFISAEGNYVAIHCTKGQTVSKKLFRNTISQMESMLQDHSQFFRCHRSYLVNLNTIKATQGNSQGLFIRMDNGTVKIPVARSKVKLLKASLDLL